MMHSCLLLYLSKGIDLYMSLVCTLLKGQKQGYFGKLVVEDGSSELWNSRVHTNINWTKFWTKIAETMYKDVIWHNEVDIFLALNEYLSVEVKAWFNKSDSLRVHEKIDAIGENYKPVLELQECLR